MGVIWVCFWVIDGSEVNLIIVIGGVIGGEVEDYFINIYGSFVYLSENGWVILVYED